MARLTRSAYLTGLTRSPQGCVRRETTDAIIGSIVLFNTEGTAYGARSPCHRTMDALQPHVSRGDAGFHYGKHHQTYVTNLNNLVPSTEFENCVPRRHRQRNPRAACSITPPRCGATPSVERPQARGAAAPAGGWLARPSTPEWGSFDAFKEAFNKSAAGNFGSGWTWLVKKADGSVDIVNTSNAATPLTPRDKPLLTCDVWEHAYYIDYRNARPKYLENFWNLVNWDFAAKNFG